MEQDPNQEIFRDEIIQRLKTLRAEMNILTHDKVSYAGWLGILGALGIASAANFVTGMLVTLAALGIISGVVCGGVSSAIAVVGFGVGLGFSFYYHYRKNKQHKRAANFFEKEGSDVDIEEIADLLTLKNKNTLLFCTEKGARKLATNLFKKISKEMMNNENFSFKSLYKTRPNTELVRDCESNALILHSPPKKNQAANPSPGLLKHGLFKRDANHKIPREIIVETVEQIVETLEEIVATPSQSSTPSFKRRS